MQLDFQWYTWAMKPPIFIRPLIDDECSQLEAARRTADAFRVRRAQIVLASARRLSPKPMAQLVGCSVQTVRNVLHAFNRRGVEGLARQSNRPKTVAPVLDAATCDRLQHLLHQSPRPHSTGFSGDAPILSQYACYFNMLPARCLIRTNCHRKGDETWHRQPNHHAKTAPSPSISTMKQPTLSSLTTPRRSSSASSPSSSPSAFSSTINRPVTAAAL